MPFFDELDKELEIESRIDNIPDFTEYYFEGDIRVDPWIDIVQNDIDIRKHPERKRIILPAPRGHSKSTTVSKIYPLISYLRKRNSRTLIIRKSEPVSKEAIKWLKDNIAHNQKIVDDFGYLKDEPWGSNILYCKREAASAASDPTFKGIGVAGAILGGHFDLIVADDIVDDQNVSTEHQRNLVAEWFYGTVLPLLEPWGQIVVLCTRKHYRDLYGELLENPTWWHPNCLYAIEDNHQRCGYKAIIKEPKYDYKLDDNGKVLGVNIKSSYEVLWPEYQTIEKLILEQMTIGSIMFNREYQNDPSGMTDLILPDSWLRYWDYYPRGGEDIVKLPDYGDMYVIAAYDLAASTKPDAHYFAYVIMGRDDQGRIFLIEAKRTRLDFPGQLKLLQEIANRPMAPAQHLIESNAYQRSLATTANWMFDIPVKPVEARGPKDERVIAITPNLENGRIFIHKSQKEFLEEYRQFPTGKYDDILDAFVMAVTELTGGMNKSLDYIMVDSLGRDVTKLKKRPGLGFY